MDRHQHLPHGQQDQADTHDRKRDPEKNHGDVGRLWTSWDRAQELDETRLWSTLIVCVAVELTVHLEVICGGAHLTLHHFKRCPALILHHKSAWQRRALVITCEEMWTYISIRKAIIFPLDFVLRMSGDILSSVVLSVWLHYLRLQSGVCSCVCVDRAIVLHIWSLKILCDNAIYLSACTSTGALKSTPLQRKTGLFGYSQAL